MRSLNLKSSKKNQFLLLNFLLIIYFISVKSMASSSSGLNLHDSSIARDETKEETYELTYDQLLERIKNKQKKIVQTTAPTAWDQINIYPSFAFIQTMTQVQNTSHSSYFQKGLQIGIGMELFSSNWFSETAYRNFGITKNQADELYLKELDFKVGYKNLLGNALEFRLSSGVSTRNFRLSNEETGFHFESKNPALLLSCGIFSNTHQSPLLLGLEANVRNVLIANEIDKGSFGLNFIFMGYF
ncbi:MAG: hypothetical protein L6Q37_13995 [Bdellovibrionaceae bacterium]|nr:hypothetical protein [Pseudobdellovibrionaceae bacterium]